MKLRTSAMLALVAGSLAASGLYAKTRFASPDDARRVYVALVPKNSVTTFYNRFAAPGAQLVVTADRVDAAKTSTKAIDIAAGEELYVVEGPFSDAPLKGEVTRIGTFALVKLPVGVSPHSEDGLNSHLYYAEAVAQREMTSPDRAEGDAAKLLSSFDKETREARNIDIDRSFLEQKLKEFSGALPTTIGGRQVTITERRSASGRDNARAFLRQEYERLGFTVREHRYGSSLRPGVNFIAELPGADTTKYVVLSAHLDSVGNAGADDDGAGTISALAIAQALKDFPLRYNLRVLGFDQEEDGLLGSSAYARQISTDGTIAGMIGLINVEMTGYDSDNDGAFHSIHCDENTSGQLSNFITNAVTRDGLALRNLEACTNRSDHAAFWRYNKPAIVISQNFFGGGGARADSNPCYHATCDKVDRVNFDYMTKLTTAIARGMADLLVDD